MLRPTNMLRVRLRVFFVLLFSALPVLAQYAPNRYAIVLSDPPAAARYSTREQFRSSAARAYRAQAQARQSSLMTQLRQRGIPVTGSVSALLNAVFVAAPASRIAEMRTLPGVSGVVPMRRGRRLLNKATDLMNAPGAWTLQAIGGRANGGAGVKIAILDTGIDVSHPAFQDAALTAPAGYPKCTDGHPEDCQGYTNGKVIVARSYVRQMAMGWVTDPANPAAESQPDDYSPRDRVGHGTAVASAAAGKITEGDAVTFSGMAPKAYLGSYKIYGSPGVNDYPPEDVWIQAIEDALDDGMDIVSFSSGFPATSGPLDVGAACGLNAGVPCDLVATAFENAARQGMVIVASAGNDGNDPDEWTRVPAQNTIVSPASAPSVIAVGATLNSHVFWPVVSVAASGAPAALRRIKAFPSDSAPNYPSSGATSAPLVDAADLGNARACRAFTSSLQGKYVLIQREPAVPSCANGDKANFAQEAGAAGLILYSAPDSTPLANNGTALEGVSAFQGPVVALSNADGVALKTYLAANPGTAVTIDLAGYEEPWDGNQLTAYSSLGPSLAGIATCPTCGKALIKPDVVASGGGDSFLLPDPNWAPLYGFQGMYTAAQSYDPDGEIYSENGYAAWDGTSVAAPLVAGAAALVKQAHPSWTVDQIRSAIINWRSAMGVTESDFGEAVDTRWIGAGLLDAGAAAKATVTAVPPTVSFGAVQSGEAFPAAQTVRVTNHGSTAVTLGVTVVPDTGHGGVTVTADKQTLAIAAGETVDLALALSLSTAPSGSYSGNVKLTGAGVAMNIPYLFLVGGAALGSAGPLPIFGSLFDGIAGTGIGSGAIKLVDANGVPMAGAAVRFTPSGAGVTMTCGSSSSSISPITCATDRYGIAYVDLALGRVEGLYSINAQAANGSQTWLDVIVRAQPATAGASDSAQGKTPIAPGSYVSLYGSNLSDITGVTSRSRLPLTLHGVTVSFDVPSAGISVPGHVLYVSPAQVNVQAPWELQGLPDGAPVQVKVTLSEFLYGKVFTGAVADISPAFFETGTNNVAARIANTATIVNSSSPAPRGGWVELYANALGPVESGPASGDPAAGVVWAKNKPTVTIGGQTAEVGYWGLAPGFPGLYQVNVRIPESLAEGSQAVVMTIAGKTASSGIPVR